MLWIIYFDFVVKAYEVLIHIITQINLQNMLNERSWLPRVPYFMIPLTYKTFIIGERESR